MPHPLDEFQSYLASRGKRLTREREIVAKVVFALRPPFTAEAVVKAVSLMYIDTRVSRATVYRTLQTLTDGGQISAEVHSDEAHYSHPYKPRLTAAPGSELCKKTHSKTIAGTCPWCGQAILNGKPSNKLE